MSRAGIPQSNSVHANSYRWVAIAIFLCSFPFSLFLPIWVSWENQILENAQAVVLLLGAVAALIFGLSTDGKRRVFWLSVVPIWLIMVARELNWGAVFFDPTSISAEGPLFASSQLWYHPYRTPVVLLMIAGFVAGFAASKAPRVIYNLLISGKFPFFDIAGFIVAMLFSTAAESHVGLSMAWWIGQNQIVEETMELAAYIFVLSAQYRVWQIFPDNSQIDKL
nr:hypothetical protein [Ochrobactrum sp. CM-21-5]